MPPLPMIALMPNSLMKRGSSEFILALVVGPAATTVHMSPFFFMMGPQW